MSSFLVMTCCLIGVVICYPEKELHRSLQAEASGHRVLAGVRPKFLSDAGGLRRNRGWLERIY